MPDGSYERSFEKAQEAQVNLAFTTNDYTDGFDNYFEKSKDAKESFGRRVFNGKIAVDDLPTIDGQNINYNPLSKDDSKYFKDSSLDYLTSSGSVLKNGYKREYYRGGEKVDNFFKSFNASSSIKTDVDSMVSRYTLQEAVNNKNNGIDLTAQLYGTKDVTQPVQADLGTLDDLRTSATSAKVTQHPGDIYKYREDLSKQMQKNKEADKDFNSKHNDDTLGGIRITSVKDPSTRRYTFKYIGITPGNCGQSYDSDKDAGYPIYFNGKLQPHRASYYQRDVGWDGDADSDFKGYIFHLHFIDTFSGEDSSIPIWVHGGMDTDSENEDYISFSILNNQLFNQQVPTWSAFDRRFSESPWIIGNHDGDFSDDDEYGQVLTDFPTNQIRRDNSKRLFNSPSIYNGKHWKHLLRDYKNTLLRYLNDKDNQIPFTKSKNVSIKKIYMSPYEVSELKRHNTYSDSQAQIGRLSKYIVLKQTGDSLTNWRMRNIKYSSISINTINGISRLTARYSSQSSGVWTFPAGSFTIPIYPKDKDWLGENAKLQEKFDSLNDKSILGTYFQDTLDINSDTFNIKDSILKSTNNKITLTYDQYKTLANSGLENIYIDLISSKGIHMSYRLNLGTLEKDNPVFSNLLDSKNINKEDIDNNVSLTIDFSKLDFIKNSENKSLEGINVMWNLLKPYNIKSPPVSLDMESINNESVANNSLLSVVQKLLDRTEEYKFAPETIKDLNDILNNFSTLIKERITYSKNKGMQSIPVFDIIRDTSLLTNNIKDISFVKNKDYGLDQLFSVLGDSMRNKVIEAYNHKYLEEFKTLLEHAILKPMTEDNKIAYCYVQTLQSYIKNSSITGQLPNGSRFKLPDFENMILNIGKLSIKNYVVQNQYAFNGSLLTNEINSIRKDNLFEPTETTKIDKYKKIIIDSFIPPYVTRLYDADGNEFRLDDTGSLLYDDEATVISNARLKAYPQRVNGMVFYNGIPKPLLNEISMIYYVEINEQTYYFKDSDSVQGFIKDYLDRFIQVIEGGTND